MIAIIVKVPTCPECYEEDLDQHLMRYNQDTEQQHELAAQQIALFYSVNSIRFRREQVIPFGIEVVTFTMEEELHFNNIVQMINFTETKIREGLQPNQEIKMMVELMDLRDKFILVRNKLREKAAEIRHIITGHLDKHKELFL